MAEIIDVLVHLTDGTIELHATVLDPEISGRQAFVELLSDELNMGCSRGIHAFAEVTRSLQKRSSCPSCHGLGAGDASRDMLRR